VLRLQPRFGATGPDVAQMERFASQERQGQARPEDLAAALTEGTVQVDDGVAHTLRTAPGVPKFTLIHDVAS
jgi:hypothetical protein